MVASQLDTIEKRRGNSIIICCGNTVFRPEHFLKTSLSPGKIPQNRILSWDTPLGAKVNPTP
jgi:hypothetical protein